MKKTRVVTYERVSIGRDRQWEREELTAQAPATPPTTAPEIIMGRSPFVLLKSIPLNAPAATVLAESCLPLKYPIPELKQLYVIATTPAEFPRKGPRRVTALRTEFRRSLGG